jgi:hypothetical protein
MGDCNHDQSDWLHSMASHVFDDVDNEEYAIMQCYICGKTGNELELEGKLQGLISVEEAFLAIGKFYSNPREIGANQASIAIKSAVEYYKKKEVTS